MSQPPNIIAVAAVTLDGKIARDSSHFTDWTSQEDKDFLHAFLDASEMIIVGNNTYQITKKYLSKRNCIVFTHSVTATKRLTERLLLCNPSGIDMRELLHNYKTVAVLGGTQTYTYFLEQGLLQEICLTIEPLVFGKGLNMFEGAASHKTNFQLISMKRLNERGSLLLHYKNH